MDTNLDWKKFQFIIEVQTGLINNLGGPPENRP